VAIEGGAMTRKNIHSLHCGSNWIAILCIGGLVCASCVINEEQRYRADQLRVVWKAEFLDWQSTCYLAGGHVIINSATDRNGIPRHRISNYACSAMVKRIH